jgi:type I restriction enzyme S subunit
MDVATNKKSKTAVPSRRYGSYKDSGVEWLGEIPAHWEITRLANIGKFSSSGIDKLIKKNESLVKIINYTDVYKNIEHTINSEMNFMEVTTLEANRIKNLLNKGDLIFLPSSETLEDLGLSALVDEDIKNLSFSYHVLRFEFTKEISHKFKKYFTNNSTVLHEFSKKGTGSIRKTLGRNDFRNTIVILPPIPEQTAIAKFLDDKTAKIDQAIALKEQQIALLKERKQIVIQQLVTGKLVKKGDVWIEPVEIKDSGVEWIGEIPEHWEVKALKFICFLQSGEFISSDDFREEGYPVYGGNGFRAYSETYTNDGFYALIGRQGALCGNVNYAKGKFYATEHAVVAYPLNGEDTLWLGETIRVANFNRLSQSAAQPGIAVGVIKNERFPYPPLPEQKQITSYIDTVSQKIDTAISLKQQEIEKLQEYKRSLIDSVVTGKVRVC